jgi:thymidylate synthase (FAD)
MTKAKLLNYTPLKICSDAIRTCWQSFDKSDDGGEKDLALIDRVGNQFKHSSTLEHINYNFYLTLSRAVLQELSRHRMASLSVKSTRYTLKELKNEKLFDIKDINRASKYVIFTDNDIVNEAIVKSLNILLQIIQSDISNDKAKYCLPEAYKTELTWSINARSLQNFLHLRTNKSALWEIRELAYDIYEALPDDHKYLFKDFLYKEEKNK